MIILIILIVILSFFDLFLLIKLNQIEILVASLEKELNVKNELLG